MYSIKAILTQEPNSVSATIIAILNLLVLAGVVHLTGQTIAAANTAVVLLLGLFYVRPLTTSKSAMNELVAPTVVVPPVVEPDVPLSA